MESTENRAEGMDINMIKKSFAAVKQDMTGLKKEIFEIKKAIFFDQSSIRGIAEKLDALNYEFCRERSNSRKALRIINKINLSRKELKDEQLKAEKIINNLRQLSYLKKELHFEQAKAKKSIKNLHKNFDSVYNGIGIYRKEVAKLLDENDKLAMQFEALKQEVDSNKNITSETLRKIFDELSVSLRDGINDFEIENISNLKNKKFKKFVAGKQNKIKNKAGIKKTGNFKKTKKKFISKIADFFAEEPD